MKYRKDLIYPVAFVVAAALSIGYKVLASGKLDRVFSFGADRAVTVESVEVTTAESSASGSSESSVSFESSTSPELISVYICGAVEAPGVYELPRGSIVNDVVLAAGGFTGDAASDRLDLVYVLSENRTIYIPTVGEVESGEEFRILSFDEGSGSGGASSESGGADPETAQPLVNINTATQAELESLPGIGPSRAQAIISYREETPFTGIEDIMNVPGIGEGRFSQIRSLICTGE